MLKLEAEELIDLEPENLIAIAVNMQTNLNSIYDLLETLDGLTQPIRTAILTALGEIA